jgi:hypothetical protein
MGIKSVSKKSLRVEAASHSVYEPLVRIISVENASVPMQGILYCTGFWAPVVRPLKEVKYGTVPVVVCKIRFA